MPAEKINEHKHTFSLKSHLEPRKLLEMKKLISEGQKRLGFDEHISELVGYLFDKIAEGKTVSIVDQTELWTVTQAAKELGVTRPTIYKMYERGDLKGISDAGLKIVPSSAVNYLSKLEKTRMNALAEMHRIDKELMDETKNLKSNFDSEEHFEEIDLD